MKSLLRSEEAWILKLNRPDSSFSTTIWWATECFGSCRFESLFGSRLCSKLHFRTQIHRESPNWSSPSFQIFNLRDRLKFQARSAFGASRARQPEFSPLTAGHRRRGDFPPVSWGIRRKMEHIPSHIRWLYFHLPYLWLPIYLASFFIPDWIWLRTTICSTRRSSCIFFLSFSRRHRSDKLLAMVVIVALISCGAGGTTTAYHSILTLSIAWHSCVSFSRLYTLP